MNKLFLCNICIILLYYIYNVKGDPIKANNKYCTHLKDKYGNNIYNLESVEISKLKDKQYLLPPDTFDKEIPDNAKLDYFVRYSVISEGFCYFEPGNIKPISHYGFRIPDDDGIEDQIKYDKTVNCFYYYYKFATEESKVRLKQAGLYNTFVRDYFQKLQKLLYNEEWCPYPDFDTMRTPIDNLPNYSSLSVQEKRAQLDKMKYEYIIEFHNFFINMKMEHCTKNDPYNEEWTFCGYATEEIKEEYCRNNPTSEDRQYCCRTQCKSRKKTVEFTTKKESIISGFSSAVVILIIGSYFSAKFINDIKIQDSMKKSIRNQEKEYNESHKQMMKEAYNQGFDVNKQVFNSRSRNLNSGTLRNTKQNTGTLRSTTGSAVSMTRSTVSQARSNVSMNNRYPPNTFNISQDYQAADSRDISLRRGMVVQLVQQYEGGWVMVKDLKTNRQGYAPEYCLGNKLG